MEDYYSIKKIMEIIKYYHINMTNLQNMAMQEIKSVGVSQYGVESSLPKGTQTSNVTEREAIRNVEQSKFWSGIITDIKYLQARWHRVTDEKLAMILNLYLTGYRTGDVAQIMQMERSWVYRNLEKIANIIKGYPQEEATKTTNFGNESLK